MAPEISATVMMAKVAWNATNAMSGNAVVISPVASANELFKPNLPVSIANRPGIPAKPDAFGLANAIAYP